MKFIKIIRCQIICVGVVEEALVASIYLPMLSTWRQMEIPEPFSEAITSVDGVIIMWAGS